MNVMSTNLSSDKKSFDVDTIDISKNSFALAKNLKSHLGYAAACKTCEQNHWIGVLAALHILNVGDS
mgnify:CR=1 FL=1|jgi:hypothetical protein